MTQPYYTLAADGTETPTAAAPTVGPVDPSAGTRAKLYSGLALLTPLLSFLASFGVFTSDQSNALIGVSTAVVGALSAFGFGLAASKTNKQVANGTFQPAPVNPVQAPLEQLAVIQDAVNKTVDQAQARVADGVNFIQAAASLIPGGASPQFGKLIPGPVGDLVQDLADRRGKL